MVKNMSRKTRYYIRDQYDNYFNNDMKFGDGFTTMGDVSFDYMDCRKVHNTKKEVRESLAYIKMYFSNRRLEIEREITILENIPLKDL